MLSNIFSQVIPPAEVILKVVVANLLSRGLKIVAIVILSLIAYQIGSFVINRFLHLKGEKEKTSTGDITSYKRALTVGALFCNLLKYLLLFISGFMILRELGVDLVPVVATAGVVGIAIGFGAQSLVKDIVSGFFILFEGWYAVGDFVRIKAGPVEVFGVVTEFGLRTTTIKDLQGNGHYVPNGAIMSVDHYTKGYLSFEANFGLPKKVEEEKLSNVLEKFLASLAAKEPFLLKAGVEEVVLTDEGQNVKIRIYLSPNAEEEINSLAEQIAGKLKELTGAKEPPAFFLHQFDPKTLAKYRKSILVR